MAAKIRNIFMKPARRIKATLKRSGAGIKATLRKPGAALRRPAIIEGRGGRPPVLKSTNFERALKFIASRRSKGRPDRAELIGAWRNNLGHGLSVAETIHPSQWLDCRDALQLLNLADKRRMTPKEVNGVVKAKLTKTTY